MRLTIRHVTTYGYAPAVPSVTMRLKLFPGRFEGQVPLSWGVTVNGTGINPELKDSWGDAVATVFARGEIGRLEIVAEGTVETVDHAGVLKNHRAAIRPAVCLRDTPRTKADAAIRALAVEATAAGGPLLDQAHRLQDAVSERIVYTPGASEMATTAAAALEAGAGVCQDHAHVLIAAARALGWPARYVAGYYLPGHADEGEIATHAWAEIWIAGLGWVGFDPANDLCPTDAYVRVSSGLDAFDAAPIRGHAEGAPKETLSVDVSIAAEGQGQSQTQQ
jgi:transglutaminase-like putative cysteine protease